MSKKIAAGASKIVLDVTCGSGAFMKDKEQATKLAQMMKKIGNLAKKETICVITNMEEPLGKAVGNSLEVQEAIKALQGNLEQDVQEVVFTLGAYMLKLAGKGENIEENKQKIQKQIQEGKAFEKCKEWIKRQGGDISYLVDLNKWEKAKHVIPVIAQRMGYVTKLDAQTVGKLAMELGAGRIKKEDSIDPLVGIILEKKVGDKVEKGEILAYIHGNDEEKTKHAQESLANAYKIEEEKIEKKNVLAVI